MRLPSLPTVLAVLVFPLAAVHAQLDLLEINTAGHPLHPGISHTFMPIGLATAAIRAEATGACAIDVDDDGLIDVMLFGTEGQSNQLWMNNGDGTFTDEALSRGVGEPSKRRGMGLFIDYDNDGDLDLMTGGYPGPAELQDLDLYSFFRNDGAPAYTFTEATAAVGGFVLAATVETTTSGSPGGMAAADYDNDGFIDVIVTYFKFGQLLQGSPDDQFRLWHNVPNPVPDTGDPSWSPRVFVDATLEAGLDGVGTGWIWMPGWNDFDRDGAMDLHLNIEKNEDELRLNLGDGTFGPNIATAVGMNFNNLGLWGREMGQAFGDYDNDGDLDVYLTNVGGFNLDPELEDAFYRNDTDLSVGGAGLSFHFVGYENGVADQGDKVGWGAVFADLDNDGDKDLITARGLAQNVGQQVVGEAVNNVWRNLYPATVGAGPTIAWEEMSDEVPQYSDFGGTLDFSRALVMFDYDNDGDLDALATRSGSLPPLPSENLETAVYMNTLNDGGGPLKKWIEVDLRGPGGSRNTVGARVFMSKGPGRPTQMQEVTAGSSFLNQAPDRLHFGLGPSGGAAWVAVRWFDGTHAVLDEVAVMTGLRTINYGADRTGDLDGDGDTDCDDLELFTLSEADEAAMDALHGFWPWRILADADGNGLRDARDFELLRGLVLAPICDLGGGLAGVSGIPLQQGTGTLQPLTPMSLSLQNAAPSVVAILFGGYEVLNLPAMGGWFIPGIDIMIVDGTNPSGQVNYGTNWPNGVPSGFQLHLQFWVQDGAAPYGWAASNGVSLRSP